MLRVDTEGEMRLARSDGGQWSGSTTRRSLWDIDEFVNTILQDRELSVSGEMGCVRCR